MVPNIKLEALALKIEKMLSKGKHTYYIVGFLRDKFGHIFLHI